MFGEKRRLKTIGKYPDISLKEARAAAHRMIALQNLPAAKRITSLQDAIARYLAECERKNRTTTVDFYRHFLKGVRDKPLDQVKSKDLKNPGSHQIMTWRVFFNWCIRHELVEKNPFAHQRVTYNQRDRVLSDDEIAAIWHYENPPYTDILKLLLLTGQRRNQIWRLDPAWYENGLLNFPASIMKSGRAHSIPVGTTAMSLLDGLPFSFNSWAKSKRRIDDVTGVTGWVVHDLRRTFATIHARLGTPIHVVEEYLAHRTGTISGVAAIYVRHNYLKEMKDAVVGYEEHLAEIVSRRGLTKSN